MVKNKKAQISFEYLIIVGFITFVIIGVMAVALFYSGSIRDRVHFTQLSNCANKVISTAESVYYAGTPSRATIICYLPENLVNIEVDDIEQSLIVTSQSSTGERVTAFPSNVPISGSMTYDAGTNKIKIQATDEEAVISPA